jgi:hypothetical protein
MIEMDNHKINNELKNIKKETPEIDHFILRSFFCQKKSGGFERTITYNFVNTKIETISGPLEEEKILILQDELKSKLEMEKLLKNQHSRKRKRDETQRLWDFEFQKLKYNRLFNQILELKLEITKEKKKVIDKHK